MAACDRVSGLAAAASRLQRKVRARTQQFPKYPGKHTLLTQWQKHCAVVPISSRLTDKPARQRETGGRPMRRIANAQDDAAGNERFSSDQTPHGIATVQEKETSWRRSVHARIDRIKTG